MKGTPVNLVDTVIAAHGGLDRWRAASRLTADIRYGGGFWAGRGWPHTFSDVTATIDLDHEHIVFDQRSGIARRHEFDVDPRGLERLAVSDQRGAVVAQRENPRTSFPRFDPATPWDEIQIAYFASVASWNYLTEPFAFARPDVRTEEIDPWNEDGETWRRLAVTFPTILPNHNPEQVFYFDHENLLRRMDYRPEVASGPAAHYLFTPREFDGIIAYTHREVCPRLPDGTALRDKAFITVDVDQVALT
jgi:hypothetical protein